MNTLADNGSLQFHSMCFRCGWATKNLHSAFDYISNSATKDIQCGKVLSNWQEASTSTKIKGGVPPDASNIKSNLEELYNFMRNLFANQVYLQSKKIKLLLIGSIMLWEDDFVSTLMQSDPETYKDNAMKHPFVTILHKAKIESGESLFF